MMSPSEILVEVEVEVVVVAYGDSDGDGTNSVISGGPGNGRIPAIPSGLSQMESNFGQQP